MLNIHMSHVTPAVKGLLASCMVVFVVQAILPLSMEARLLEVFGLGVEGFMRGWWWQLLSYAFLHGSIMHILLNMLGLFFLGPELERYLGPRIFLLLFFTCIMLGGVGWLVLTWPYAGICVGASGGVFGLIGAFAGLFPRRQLTLLVFFILPVTMPAWLLALLFGFIQLGYLLDPGESGIAYAAHLAGGLAGFIFSRVVCRQHDRLSFRRSLSHAGDATHMRPSQAEVDAILDKISTEGLHKISAHEREVLRRAGRK